MKISKQKENSRKISIINKIGVFSVSLFVAASAVYLYSPVIGTHADSSAPVSISTEIGTVMSIKYPENIDYAIQGNELKNINIDTYVLTNNQYGYSLTFSAKGTQTAMKNGNYEIPSVASDVINPGALTDNTYGYLSVTKDAPIVHPIPTEDNPALVFEYPSPVTDANHHFTIPLYYKFGPIASLASGQYSNTFVLSVYANGVDPDDVTIADYPGPTMQTFRCTLLKNVGDSMELEDTRDGNIYTVKKLADNRCWMTDNLRLINKTITGEDSNLLPGETWTVPASQLKPPVYDGDQNQSGSFTLYNQNEAYVDSNGGYYSFYTATAGWGTGGDTVEDGGVAEGYSYKDICPKGWRLPYGVYSGSANSNEFVTLAHAYNTGQFSNNLLQGDPGFTLSGRAHNGQIEVLDYSGHYWTSSAHPIIGTNSDGSSYLIASLGDSLRLDIPGSSSFTIHPTATEYKFMGFSIRCIYKF